MYKLIKCIDVLCIRIMNSNIFNILKFQSKIPRSTVTSDQVRNNLIFLIVGNIFNYVKLINKMLKVSSVISRTIFHINSLDSFPSRRGGRGCFAFFRLFYCQCAIFPTHSVLFSVYTLYHSVCRTVELIFLYILYFKLILLSFRHTI